MAAEPSPSQGQPRGRRDPRGARRRAELLDAAIHLIGAHGLDAVTHRAVAAEAGAPAASTSYYFRSKDELIDEALRRVAEREIVRLRERRLALGDGVRDLATVTEALATWIEDQLTPAGRIGLVAQYHLQIEAARRPAAREILETWKDGTDELAEQAMRSLDVQDVVNAAILLVSAIDGLRLRLLASGHEPLEPAELRAVIGRLLRALAASS